MAFINIKKTLSLFLLLCITSTFCIAQIGGIEDVVEVYVEEEEPIFLNKDNQAALEILELQFDEINKKGKIQNYFQVLKKYSEVALQTSLIKKLYITESSVKQSEIQQIRNTLSKHSGRNVLLFWVHLDKDGQVSDSDWVLPTSPYHKTKAKKFSHPILQERFNISYETVENRADLRLNDSPKYSEKNIFHPATYKGIERVYNQMNYQLIDSIYEARYCSNYGVNPYYLILKNEGKYGLLDQYGAAILPFEYDEMGCYIRGLKSGLLPVEFVIVKKGDYQSVVSISGKDKGKSLLPYEYESLEYFKHLRAFKAKKDGKYGLIELDKPIKAIVPIQYTDFTPMGYIGGQRPIIYYSFQKEDQWHLVKDSLAIQKQTILQKSEEDFINITNYMSYPKVHKWIFKENGLYGIVDSDGNIIEAIYPKIYFGKHPKYNREIKSKVYAEKDGTCFQLNLNAFKFEPIDCSKAK